MTITSGRGVTDALIEIQHAMERSPDPGRRVAERSVEMMKAKMDEPKSGQMYGPHRASAPGEAPAVNEGEIYNGFRVEVSGASASVFNDSDHWMHMEYGTINVAPRPFITTALGEGAAELEQLYADELARLIEGRGSTSGSGARVAQGGRGGSPSKPAPRVASPRNMLK